MVPESVESLAVIPSAFNAAPDGLAVSSFTAVNVPFPVSSGAWLSFARIVPVALAVDIFAPTAFDRVTLKVSVGS